jgi:hypothetical protein
MSLAFEASLLTLQSAFTCHKILGHGASGFTSLLKEGVQRIFIALENQFPQQGLYPRTWSTLEGR